MVCDKIPAFVLTIWAMSNYEGWSCLGCGSVPKTTKFMTLLPTSAANLVLANLTLQHFMNYHCNNYHTRNYEIN
uniref:Uncharacterized protein n=1 Tax=Ciona intestinalis TaxID=7719 RepID=H2XY28_CIOIN